MVNKECQAYKYAINKYGVSKKTEPMACTTDFIDFVCSQIKDAGTVRARKMFGDWMIYVDEKPVIIACDNVCFIKMLSAVHDLMADALTAHSTVPSYTISLTSSIVIRLSKSFGHLCRPFPVLRKGRRNRSGEHACPCINAATVGRARDGKLLQTKIPC